MSGVSRRMAVQVPGSRLRSQHLGRQHLGWRILGVLWLAILVTLGGGIGVLQYLGPIDVDSTGPTALSARPREGAGLSQKLPVGSPTSAPLLAAKPYEPPPPLSPAKPVPEPAAGASPTQSDPAKLEAMRTAATEPTSGGVNPPGSPIAAPIGEILEVSPEIGGVGLPRVAPGQKPPMQAYAGGFDPADHRPHVALILAGIGLSETDSEEAIRILPPAVTLAVSAYASDPEVLLQKARARGHEFILSIPMEAQGFPVNDEGPHALLTGGTRIENRDQLYWSLSRFAGYAGATGALDGMRGERFAAAGEQMGQMLDELARRGLYYIDPRPGVRAPLHIRGRSVDVLIDEPPVRAEIANHLAQLEQIARDKGQALGLVGLPRPVTVDQLSEWSMQLGSHGLVLVPVSALLQPVTAALR